jgi:hypothetical protein
MTARPELKAGARLKSAVCDAEVVVIRPPAEGATIECGGVPMRALDDDAPRQEMAGDPGEGTALGKRYADDELGIELLCSKAGTGSLSVDGRPLPLKGAKPLPSSD